MPIDYATWTFEELDVFTFAEYDGFLFDPVEATRIFLDAIGYYKPGITADAFLAGAAVAVAYVAGAKKQGHYAAGAKEQTGFNG